MVENAAGGQAANEKTSNKLNQVITPMILLKGELFNIIFTQILEITTVIICHLFKVFSDETSCFSISNARI